MMCAYNAGLHVETKGRGTYDITEKVQKIVRESNVSNGQVTLFIQHTSASLLIFENADPSARIDLERFFRNLIPEDVEYFTHTLEGSDDMPSHIRMALTRTSECIPIVNGQMALGSWQGIFLYEHRGFSHNRSIMISVIGERP
jgi:secondary thiamine-phosphate synthase enzyme